MRHLKTKLVLFRKDAIQNKDVKNSSNKKRLLDRAAFVKNYLFIVLENITSPSK